MLDPPLGTAHRRRGSRQCVGRRAARPGYGGSSGIGAAPWFPRSDRAEAPCTDSAERVEGVHNSVSEEWSDIAGVGPTSPSVAAVGTLSRSASSGRPASRYPLSRFGEQRRGTSASLVTGGQQEHGVLVELLALVGHNPWPTEESSFVVAESPFLPTSGGTSSTSRASSAAPMASIARDFGIPELRRPSPRRSRRPTAGPDWPHL